MDKKERRCRAEKNVFARMVIGTLLPLSAAISIVIFLSGCGSSASTAAYVNGYPISSEELQRGSGNVRTDVVSYFSQKYGVSIDGSSWETDYNGEVPAVIARKKAFDMAVRVKLQQALARDRGLIRDVSYSAFLAEMGKENEKRKEDREKGKPVYGLTQFNEKTYFDYSFSSMVDSLKKKMGEKEFQADAETLKGYYESNKDRIFKTPDGGYMPYSEVEAVVKAKYVDEKYAEYIDELVKKADVRIIHKVYDQISIR